MGYGDYRVHIGVIWGIIEKKMERMLMGLYRDLWGLGFRLSTEELLFIKA